MDEYLDTPEFFRLSVKRLSGAIKINTTSNDDMQDLPGHDPAWDHIFPFGAYLKDTFPLIHQSLDLERINTHGLVYTWHGKTQDLKPTLLGSIDCKTTLIASIEAIEELLNVGFAPNRTVILAFGFDEEISGTQGAKRIAAHLLERYGEGRIALLVDEGPGFLHALSLPSIYAVPGFAEKGYLDVELVVHMESGHSLLPPKENSITIMAALISKIQATPFQDLLNEGNPFLDTIFCVGQNDKSIDEKNRNIIKKIDSNGTAVNDYLDTIETLLPSMIPFFRTTQSQAIIRGGYKVNVIPERTALRINHRIVPGTTTNYVKNHLEGIIKDFLDDFKANYSRRGDVLSFPGWDQKGGINSIALRTLPGSLEPSPPTPSSVNGVTPYSVLHGTTRALYGENITMVAPILMPANSDGRHYSNVTRYIFRFSPGHDLTDKTDNQIHSHAHGVNERANMQGHVNSVKWYSMFIRNMDEADMG